MEHLGISLFTAIGILVLLLIFSAFFSGSETALTRARRVRLKLLSDQGNGGARQATRLLKKPELMLSTILLGNNFVNIAATSLATAIFVDAFGEAGVLYATVAMTVVVLIFSEALPKTIAVAHAEFISCLVSTPLYWIQRLLAPLTFLLIHILNLFRHLFRVPHRHDTGFSHQELATMINISAESGMLDTAREQMLHSSLRLHELPIKALMTPRKDIIALNADLPVKACQDEAIRAPHSRYPAYRDNPDSLIGIIHLRDLIQLNTPEVPLAHATLWNDPLYAPANRDALSQLFEFQGKRQHMAIVVDEFGDIEGLITLEDIIEEIVGEIVDESDIPAMPESWPQPDGSLVVAGTANLHEINQALNAHLPQDVATTIGGLIVHQLGDQPEDKACLQISDTVVELLTIEDGWIQRVKVSKFTPEHEDSSSAG